MLFVFFLYEKGFEFDAFFIAGHTIIDSMSGEIHKIKDDVVLSNNEGIEIILKNTCMKYMGATI